MIFLILKRLLHFFQFCARTGFFRLLNIFILYNSKWTKLQKEEMLSSIEKYIKNLNPCVTVLINPEVFDECKTEFREQ